MSAQKGRGITQEAEFPLKELAVQSLQIENPDMDDKRECKN